MKKKNYIKPTVKVINLRQRSMILCGSPDPYQKIDDPVVPNDAPNAVEYNGIFG